MPRLRRVCSLPALLLGKNNLQELAFGITSNNAAFGAVRNPCDLERIPGGSSGVQPLPCEQACVRPVSVPIQVARFGFRRRFAASLDLGRALGDGLSKTSFPSQALETPQGHWLDVFDLSLLNEVVTGEPGLQRTENLKGVRIGVPESYFWENLDSETEEVSREALRRLQAAGAKLIYAGVEGVGRLNSAVSFPVAL